MDFFDEIIDTLQNLKAKSPTVDLSADTIEAFFQDKISLSGKSTSNLPPEPAVKIEMPTHGAKETAATLTQPHMVDADEKHKQIAFEDRKRSWLAASTLAELESRVEGCDGCNLCKERSQTVFGEGNPQAELMFIGEAPGFEEDIAGRVFVGAAGQLLTKMIEAMQFSREEVYIANIVKCRPPGNRNPAEEEAMVCLDILKRQIELVRPRAIVVLGAVPLQYLLNIRGVTRYRGKWLNYNDIPVMVTYHPAFLLRQLSAKKEAWSDLQQVMKVFGKTPVRSARSQG